MTKKVRRINLCHAIELAYGSLQSHYAYAIESPKKKTEILGDDAFAAGAIREYAEIILVCASELEQLAKEQKKKQ